MVAADNEGSKTRQLSLLLLLVMTMDRDRVGVWIVSKSIWRRARGEDNGSEKTEAMDDDREWDEHVSSVKVDLGCVKRSRSSREYDRGADGLLSFMDDGEKDMFPAERVPPIYLGQVLHRVCAKGVAGMAMGVAAVSNI